MKTPEEMAEEYIEELSGELLRFGLNVKTDRLFKLKHMKDAFLTGYKAAQQWISVKDRLPEEGEEVLVFGQYLNDIPKVLGVRSRYKGDQDWKYTWEGSDEWIYRENDVTHWMPLPAPPKEEK